MLGVNRCVCVCVALPPAEAVMFLWTTSLLLAGGYFRLFRQLFTPRRHAAALDVVSLLLAAVYYTTHPASRGFALRMRGNTITPVTSIPFHSKHRQKSKNKSSLRHTASLITELQELHQQSTTTFTSIRCT